MNTNKNLTLVVLNYVNGMFSLSGQHEEAIVVRVGGRVERIDTIDLGFSIGLDDAIAAFVDRTFVKLNSGEILALYTDGITEAENLMGEFYDLDGLCTVLSQNWQKSAEAIKQINKLLTMNVEPITGESYHVEYHPDTTTIDFQGVLRLAGMTEYEPIERLLTGVAATNPPTMTLNLQELEFLNSSGFSILSKFAIAMRKQKITKIITIGSQNIAWQAKSLKNLKRLMPNLTVELK